MLPSFVQRLLTVKKGKTVDDATKREITDAMKPLVKLLGGAVPLPTETTEEIIPSNELEAVCEHPVWRRGILSGGRYIKSCWSCGTMKDVDFAEWQTISDR